MAKLLLPRYGIIIREAVQLVLIAPALGGGGEIFVLDMGSPVKIMDLAENFIRLSGFSPHKEIKIKFTGLRPGEKLYEDLFDETERIMPTGHKKLMMAVPDIPSADELAAHMAELEHIVNNYAISDVVPKLQTIVPNFKSGITDAVAAGGGGGPVSARTGAKRP